MGSRCRRFTESTAPTSRISSNCPPIDRAASLPARPWANSARVPTHWPCASSQPTGAATTKRQPRLWSSTDAMRKTELFFDSIADVFLQRMNPFDQQARVDWFRNAAAPQRIAGATMLDVGAGLGHFSDAASDLGAHVVPV